MWYIHSKETYSAVKINELTDIYINMDESQKYTGKLKKLDPPPDFLYFIFHLNDILVKGNTIVRVYQSFPGVRGGDGLQGED